MSETIDSINMRLGEIDAEIDTIAGLTDPTEEDAARAEALQGEAAELRTKRLQAVELREKIAETAARNRAEKGTTAGFSFNKGIDPYADDVRLMNLGQMRDAARSILDRPEAGHLAPEAKDQFDRELRSKDQRLAKYAIVTSQPAYRSAFAKALAGQASLWDNDERRAVAAAEWSYRTDLALADANGGYAVPALLDSSVIWTGSKNTHPMRQIARVVTGMDDTWRGVSSAGITATTVGEATALTEAGPTFAQPTVTAYKTHVYVEYSWEIAEDWSSLTSEIMMGINEAFDDWETTNFGTGTTPVGIVTALVAGSGTVSNVAPTTDGQFGAVDVRALFAALPQKFRANATWLSSIDVQNEISSFDTTGGLSLQTVSLRDTPFSYSLLGKPYAELASMDSFTGTTGVANLLVVGDFRKYVIFDRIGQRVVPVPVVVDGSGVPTGQSGVAVYRRIGADSIADNAFRLLRNV